MEHPSRSREARKHGENPTRAHHGGWPAREDALGAKSFEPKRSSASQPGQQILGIPY